MTFGTYWTSSILNQKTVSGSQFYAEYIYNAFALLFEFYKIYFIWFNALTTASTPARPTLVDFPAPQYWFPSSHVICT